MRSGLTILLILFPLVAGARPESSSATPSTPVSSIDPCAALLKVDFSGIQDAPTKVVSATQVAPTKGTPALCRIEGYVVPKVGFELRLPSSSWNGKLVAVGNVGWGGGVRSGYCDGDLRRGYACVASDTGHSGPSDDGLWAANDLPAQVDFGYRSVHVMALAAKAIVAKYYLKDVSRSYFVGCSTGGYEGLVEAQRFPWDFDGIIAGAPDMDEADLVMRELWGSRNSLEPNGQPVLDENHIRLLHQAVLAKCDKDDGVADGIVSNPLACRFDPATLLCKSDEHAECLTQHQVDAIRRIYSGPPLPGLQASIRGVLPGSEQYWSELGLVGPESGQALFRHMIYGASPEWSPDNYDFSRDYKRLGLGAIYTDTNPDLRRFRAAGGKLLVYQGWTDITEMPTAAVDYYETVERTMGGRASTESFFRLFMIPGMNHCRGGEGAFSIDYLTYLEAWVEQGKAPDAMVGAHISESYLKTLPREAEWPAPDLLHGSPRSAGFPITFTRPVYPYPFYAKYSGAGDPKDAANFVPSEANPVYSANVASLSIEGHEVKAK